MNDLTYASDVTLMQEVEARKVLREHRLRLSVLAPYGSWIGCGRLRVLHVKAHEDFTTLVVGYESYHRLPDQPQPRGERA